LSDASEIAPSAWRSDVNWPEPMYEPAACLRGHGALRDEIALQRVGSLSQQSMRSSRFRGRARIVGVDETAVRSRARDLLSDDRREIRVVGEDEGFEIAPLRIAHVEHGAPWKRNSVSTLPSWRKPKPRT
jgi:hypothetical protein